MSKACNLKGIQKVFFLQSNKIASCCRAHPEPLSTDKTLDDYVKQWENEALLLEQGHELAGCETCWVRERQNLPSLRTSVRELVPLTRVELYISNACNQQCSYCSPKFSSEWENDIKKHGVFKRISSTAKSNQQVLDSTTDVDYWLSQLSSHFSTCEDNSVLLTLLGGEPLMQRANLETVLELNSAKIRFLEIVTNLNPPNDKFLKYIIDKSDRNKLLFSISLDAVPEWNHVPRARFKSSVFEKNLELLKTQSIKHRFYTVLSVLNIFDISRYLKWNQGQDQYWNVLSNPICLDVSSIPVVWRTRIWETLESPPKIIEDQLLSKTEPVDILLFEQYNYLIQYFQRVGIEPAKLDNQLFVEYWLFLESKFK